MILKQLIENGNDGSLCPLRFGVLVFALLSTSCFFGLAMAAVFAGVTVHNAVVLHRMRAA